MGNYKIISNNKKRTWLERCTDALISTQRLNPPVMCKVKDFNYVVKEIRYNYNNTRPLISKSTWSDYNKAKNESDNLNPGNVRYLASNSLNVKSTTSLFD